MFQSIGEMVVLFLRTVQAFPQLWRQKQKVRDQLFDIGNASLLMACILSLFHWRRHLTPNRPAPGEIWPRHFHRRRRGRGHVQRTGPRDDGHPDRRPHRLGDGRGDRLDARLPGNRRATHDEHRPDSLPCAAAHCRHQRRAAHAGVVRDAGRLGWRRDSRRRE